MRWFRSALICFLCVAIPLQGIAGGIVAQPPCPVEGAQSSAGADVGDAQSCCQDAATFAKTGKACKAGQECPPGGQCALSCGGGHALLPLPASHFSNSASPPPPSDLAAIWRPPAFL